MAHGDTTPWMEFEFGDYLQRLEDLLEVRNLSLAVDHGPGGESNRWIRANREIEETALELTIYMACLRMGDVWEEGYDLRPVREEDE